MASLLKEMPSMSTVLSAYASLSALAMLVRTILNEVIPKRMGEFISDKLSDLFSTYFSSDFTFVVEDRWQAVQNETYRAVEAYLPTKTSGSTKSLLLGSNDCNNITAPPKQGIPVDTKVVEEFQGVKFEWTLREKESKTCYSRNSRYFELKCNKKHKDEVIKTYIPHICKSAEAILSKRETLNLYTYDNKSSRWESAVFKHPATFETLAMDPDLKAFILRDLDQFLQGKTYFQSLGRAWKRGYLLHGPPGTGKSTLVAAIANRLRFHVYDLQLQGVKNDSDLRRILTSTTNRSILLIEDIDCSTKSSRSRARGQRVSSDDDGDRISDNNKASFDPGVTLSGLLNFIDGLWSSCGDERIIIFTTNYKDKLDPALVRPGRMDVPIYMGPCTPSVFKKLAETYLGIKEHILFKCIEDLIERIEITPAEVAQQLMKCQDPQFALESLIDFINMKNNTKLDDHKKDEDEVIKQEIVMLAKADVKQLDNCNENEKS